MEQEIIGVLIHEFRKNSTEVVKVRLMKYKERDVVDFRVFVETPEGFQPTKKGIMLGTKLLPEMKKSIYLLEKYYKKPDENKTTTA